MTTADSISTAICDWLGRRTMLSTGTRAELRELVAKEFAIVAPREQPALDFDICAGNHNGNAQSVKAAQEGSGRRPSQRQRIFTYLHSQGNFGATCEEIEIALNMRHQTCSARVAELKGEGLIRLSGRERLTTAGSKADVLVVS